MVPKEIQKAQKTADNCKTMSVPEFDVDILERPRRTQSVKESETPLRSFVLAPHVPLSSYSHGAG
jgi:hypothetical protein